MLWQLLTYWLNYSLPLWVFFITAIFSTFNCLKWLELLLKLFSMFFMVKLNVCNSQVRCTMHLKRISLCTFCDVQRGYYTRLNVHVLQLFKEKHIHNGLYAIKQTIPHAYMFQDPNISPVEVLYFIMYRKHYFSKLTNTS